MPRGRKPEGEYALSNAERQARHRARLQTSQPSVVIKLRKPVDRRSRPRRWNDALAEMLAIQADCAAWFDALPDSLRDKRHRDRSPGDHRSRPRSSRRDRAAPRLWP
jgi:hypothetical protein